MSYLLLHGQSEGQWQEGPEDGGIARTQAARLLAELAAVPDMHPLLVKVGAASALASRGALLVGVDSVSHPQTSCKQGSAMSLQALVVKFTTARLSHWLSLGIKACAKMRV